MSICEATIDPSDNVRHEGRVSSSIAHEISQEEVGGKQLFPISLKKKKGRPRQELNGPPQQRPTSTTKKGRQTTYPSNPLHRSNKTVIIYSPTTCTKVPTIHSAKTKAIPEVRRVETWQLFSPKPTSATYYYCIRLLYEYVLS